MEMTVPQVKHVQRAGHGRTTRAHGQWPWEEAGRCAGTPCFLCHLSAQGKIKVLVSYAVVWWEGCIRSV